VRAHESDGMQKKKIDVKSRIDFYISHIKYDQMSPVSYNMSIETRHQIMDFYNKIIDEQSTDTRNLNAAEKIVYLFNESIKHPTETDIQVDQIFLNDVLADMSRFQAEMLFLEETAAVHKLVTGILLLP